MKYQYLCVLFVLANMITLIGCGGSANTTSAIDSSAIQAAMDEANSQATASEGAGAVGLLAACNYTTARGACGASADTVTWGGCTVLSGAAAMTGSWTETFSGAGAGTCTVPVGPGESVVRTSVGSTLTSVATGAYITTDTNGGTAWDGTVLPATGTSVSNTAGTRTITINGTHKVAKTASNVTLYDHFLATTTPITMTGTRAGTNRTITAGAMNVYHNLAQYTAAITFSGVQWTNAACCYPTAGTIAANLSGSVAGTSSITFSTTCGLATFTDNSGTSSAITLTQCN